MLSLTLGVVVVVVAAHYLFREMKVNHHVCILHIEESKKRPWKESHQI